MRPTEISQRLDDLQLELVDVKAMSEERACKEYNADSKQDIIDALQEEIDALESYRAEEYDDDGMDYRSLQLSQGLPVTFW